MGKWIALLDVEEARPLTGGTDETRKTLPARVASVLSVGAGKGPANSSPIEPGPDLSAVAWTDGDIAAFLARRARLMRWGWSEADAERLAERLVIRDREADARVSCADCKHYRPGRCANCAGAGLSAPDVGRNLATLLQRCPGFQQGD
jgi:hypothetical protein